MTHREPGGSVVTFEAFLIERTGWLLRFATALTGDSSLAEELVQDVLVKAHQRWSTIEALDSPAGYVRRMLVNEHVSWRRKWARLIPSSDALPDVVVDDLATEIAERDALLGQLRQLPSRQQAVLTLRYFESLTDTEIAEILGCRVTTVRAYASRALATLRAGHRVKLTQEEGPAR